MVERGHRDQRADLDAAERRLFRRPGGLHDRSGERTLEAHRAAARESPRTTARWSSAWKASSPTRPITTACCPTARSTSTCATCRR
ncbi:hypothetical protein ACRAWD_16770 [Caulobacter segnis]